MNPCQKCERTDRHTGEVEPGRFLCEACASEEWVEAQIERFGEDFLHEDDMPDPAEAYQAYLRAQPDRRASMPLPLICTKCQMPFWASFALFQPKETPLFRGGTHPVCPTCLPEVEEEEARTSG